ncbi:MAG TPA: hypothetical protein VFZ23_16330 [Pyrinomonadaceae bacterium]
MSNSNKISIEGGTWYYFTTDLNFKGFLPFRFLRFLDVNGDRNGAVVEFIAGSFFETTKVILLPYTKEPDYFRVEEDGLLPVWTFDGSDSESLSTVDLQTDWPQNILDKAAITPSIENARKWTAK